MALEPARHARQIFLPLLALLLIAVACGTDTDDLAATLATAPVVTVAPTTEAPSPESTEAPAGIAPPTTAPAPTTTAEQGGGAGFLDPENVGAPGLGDSYYPGLGNGGYDVALYELDLTVSPSGSIEAITTIDALATQDLSAFNLDFQFYEITELTVDGAEAQFSRTETELTIQPETMIREGEIFEATIHYEGVPQPVRSASAPGGQLGWQTTRTPGHSYIANEPDGTQGWMPVNNHPQDKAAFTFRITVPAGTQAIANGLLTDTSEAGDTVSYTWVATDPMAPYLASVNIGDFELVDGGAFNGIPIRNAFPPDLVEAATFDFGRTAQMLEVFSELFGPYPFEVYGSIVIDQFLGFAMENQTISLYGRDLVSGSRQFEWVAAHELAHQWFGDWISTDDWTDIWLNEGFASYSEQLWQEAINPDFDIFSYYTDTWEIIGRRLGPPGDPGANDLFNQSVYERGGAALHALRVTIGDDAFFTTVRTYVERFGGGTATTADLQAVAEEISGQDLDEFIDAWIYQPVAPAMPR